MPKIGLRNIKTAIAILICIMLYVILLSINSEIANGWYTPFYAGIATAYSVSTTGKKSLTQAKIRSISSIIGGLFGMLLIFLYQSIGRIEWPDFGRDKPVDFIIPYILVAGCCIFLIYITVITKQTSATFVAVLTYLSITTNARYGIAFWQFGLNRILSTLIGVGVALGVNVFHIPHYKNKKAVFFFGIDGLYSNDNSKINGYINYKLNKLLLDGANISIYSTRVPAILIPMLGDVVPNMPCILLNGAALYDVKEKHYLYVENINLNASNALRTFFEAENVSPFLNLILHDVLHTYCASIDNIGEENYAYNRRNSAYNCFIFTDAPLNREITYFMVIEETKKIEDLVNKIKQLPIYNEIVLETYDCYETSGIVLGYHYLKIYSKKINDLEVMRHFSEYTKVGLCKHEYDLPLALNVDYSYTTSDASDSIKSKSTVVNGSNDAEALIKQLTKSYIKRPIKK